MRPAMLKPGDTIAIVSPSWGGAGMFPQRLARGVAWLEARGYRVVLMPHALGQRGYVSGTPRERADDINAAFADPQVRAIIATIGGDHSCQLLPLLDWELIRANPKIFAGYSDITVLCNALFACAGLTTFYPLSLLVDLAEYPHPQPYTVASFQRALCSPTALGDISPATEWTEEFLDWATQQDAQRPRVMQPSPGWTWLKGGMGSGPLIGGCLESLQHLRGTPYWPRMDGALWFWETSEERPDPSWVDAVLQDYDNMGVFAQLRGMLIGRSYGYSEAQRVALRAIVLERTSAYNFPIIADMDFGHTAPEIIFPIGCQAEIDADAQRFAITQAGVSAS